MSRPRHILTWLTVVAAGSVLCGATWWWHWASKPENRWRRGQEAARVGDWIRAERYALRLEAGGDLDFAHLLRGEMCLRQDDVARAVTEYNGIRDPEIRLEASALYGQWYLLRLKRPVEAERFLRSVVAERPDHVDAHRGLASVYYDQGAWALAVQHLECWGRQDLRDGRPYRLMGLIYKDLDQSHLAVRCYREALGRNLKGFVAAEVKQELAECLARQSHYGEALETLDGCATARAQASPQLQGLRGECLWGLGQADQARVLVDSVLREDATAGELLLLRARMYMADGAAAEALPLLERALQVNPHDHASRYELAQAYEGLGRRPEAAAQRRLLSETQETMAERGRLTMLAGDMPWDASVRRRLADVCQKLQMSDQSSMWRRAAEACPQETPAVVAAADRSAVPAPPSSSESKRTKP